jgi:hypothetical protein
MKRLISIIAFLVVATVSYAAVGFLSSPVLRVWDSTGTKLLTSGYIVTCLPGTTCGCTSFTGKTTYTDSTGLIANSNPVLLDSTGSASIWYDGLAKIAACDRFGNLQWSRDNVPSISYDASPSVTEWVAISATPIYSSGTQFMLLGDYTTTFTPGRRSKITLSSGEARYYTVVSSSFSSGITTINIISDTTGIDSTINTVYVGILDPAYSSLPIQLSVNKSAGYNMAVTDINRNFVFSSLSSTLIVTLPSATLVPSGSWISIKSTGTSTSSPVIVNGAVENRSSFSLLSNDYAFLYSNGTNTWRGNIVTTYPQADAIPKSNDSGYITTGWFESQKIIPVYTTITSSGTWTVPSGVTEIYVTAFGGGGGGGSGRSGTNAYAGGGGGAGGRIYKYPMTVSSGETITISIGIGGTGGTGPGSCTSDGANGTSGIDTIVTTTTGSIKVTGGGYGYGGNTVSGAAGAQGTVFISGVPTPTGGAAVGGTGTAGGSAIGLGGYDYLSYLFLQTSTSAGAGGWAPGSGDFGGGGAGGGRGGGNGGTNASGGANATGTLGAGGGGGSSANYLCSGVGNGGNGAPGSVSIVYYIF